MIQFQPLNGTLQLQVHGQHNTPLFPTHHQPIVNNKKEPFLLKSYHSSLFFEGHAMLCVTSKKRL